MSHELPNWFVEKTDKQRAIKREEQLRKLREYISAVENAGGFDIHKIAELTQIADIVRDELVCADVPFDRRLFTDWTEERHWWRGVKRTGDSVVKGWSIAEKYPQCGTYAAGDLVGYGVVGVMLTPDGLVSYIGEEDTASKNTVFVFGNTSKSLLIVPNDELIAKGYTTIFTPKDVEEGLVRLHVDATERSEQIA